LETLLQLSFKELRDAAGVRPARKAKKKKETRVRTEEKIASTSAPAPAPDPVIITLGPPPSVESVVSPGPADAEKKVLAELIA